MTNDPRHQACEEYADNLAELALGILTGRERAAALAHVDSCPRCAEELEQLSHVSDAVLSVAPEVEPTVGFEVRLFNRMGVTETPSSPSIAAPGIAAPSRRATPRRWATAPPRWALAAAAVVIALVLGLALGLSHGSGPTGTKQAEGTSGGGGHGRPDRRGENSRPCLDLRGIRPLDDRDTGWLFD